MRRSIVQGFYQNENTAHHVRQKLENQGFGRWAEIKDNGLGQSVEVHRHFDYKGIFRYLVASLILLSVLYFFQEPLALSSYIDWVLRGTLLFLAVLGGILLYFFPAMLSLDKIKPLKSLLTKGEILLLVEVEPGEVREVLDIMRQVISGHPVSYLIRPPLPWIMDDTSKEIVREPLLLDMQKARAVEMAYACKVEGVDYSSRIIPGTSLLKRLEKASDMLKFLKRDVAESEAVEQATTVSAEWLLDNMYVIKSSIEDVQRNLPKRYYKTLPKLKTGPFKGLPRIFRIAQEIVSITAGKVTKEGLLEYLNSFQTVLPLTIGELWALPLMVRLSLVEGIKNLAIHIDHHMREGELAGFWGNRLLHAAHREPAKLDPFIERLKEEISCPSPHFAQDLLDHLFDEETILVKVREWLEKCFQMSLADNFQQDQMREAADQVAFSNSIISLITLSQLSWPDIFESASTVDTFLRKDPIDVYSRMDFRTRNTYRSKIEGYARGIQKGEIEVTKVALGLANQGKNDYERHVGYYLIDNGRKKLEHQLGYNPPLKEKFVRAIKKYPGSFYIGAIFVFTSLLIGGFYTALRDLGVEYYSRLFLSFAAVIPISEVVCQFLHLLFSKIIHPSPLPHMSFEGGIPNEFKTLVVVPTLLMTPESIEHDLTNLEIRFLANNEKNLNFALLTDFKDALSKETNKDNELLSLVTDGIKALKEKYGDRFYLFHRCRDWSASENKWIGWERKRGKIEVLNRYLMGEEQPQCPLLLGDKEALKDTKFVLTLDADTQLPKDKGRELVEVLAHILNRPVIDKENRKLIRGYTIIQPRVCSDFSQTRSTLFTLLFSEPYLLDPYTNAVSNFYQDLTGKGSFHGKGLYDLEAFHTILSGRYPENTLLSHDLLEGAYASVGFASEICLWDFFPEDTVSWAARQHRWIRGDFQIIDWLFPKVPGHNGVKERNPLSAIDRWKIFDNLRRSSVTPSIMILLIGSFLITPFTWVPLLITAFLYLLPFALALFDGLRHFTIFGNREKQTEILTLASRATVNFVAIPFESFLMLDAALRVFYRKTISHKSLLQWTPSAKKSGLPVPVLLTNSGALAFSAFIAGLVFIIAPQNLAYALPIAALWALNPFLSKWLSRPLKENADKELNDEDRLLAKLVARKTWRYFDDFMNQSSNWLPPDNYQLGLKTEIAERTSPTNIGLGLISVQSAYDLRFLTCDSALYRMGQTLESLRKLEKYHGHFLNWYNTTTLQPLLPRYISTVDSGNLIACFWDLQSGLYDIATRPVLPLNALDGCRDVAIFLEREGNLTDEQVTLLDIIRRHSPSSISLIEQIEEAYQFSQNLEAPVGGPEFQYWHKKLVEEIGAWRDITTRYFHWKILLKALLSTENIYNKKVIEEALLFAPTLTELSKGSLNQHLEDVLNSENKELQEELSKSQWLAGEAIAGLNTMKEEFGLLGDEMDLKFLFNTDKKLLTIGYNLDEKRQDTSYYDLLASEARIASLVGIAKGDLPVDHWWALGRSWTKVDGRKVLISWGGTMFEYLMPLIFMHQSPNSLLGAACRAAVEAQIDYGNKRGIPWGISEAAFSAIDSHKTYQYRSFGIPALGLKRGLEEDLVVSPYSSGLALHVLPKAAIKNLKILAKREGGNYLPPWGFYESIDYSRQKDRSGERGVIIYAFMAHHQGMMLASLNNLLNDNVIQKRFHADLKIAGVESLLSERVPTVALVKLSGVRHKAPPKKLTPFADQPIMGVVETPFSTVPKINLLSNGSYSLMLTNSGGGYSFWNGVDVSRWRSDPTCDPYGHFFYIKDLKTNDFWSSGYHPTLKSYQDFSVSFKPDKVDFRRKDNQIETLTEITISPEDNAEITLVTLINHSEKNRSLEITSYIELALAPHNADRAHMAFSKMFIETEKLEGFSALLATRRPRSSDESKIWAAHSLSGGTLENTVQYETDRNHFIGRGGSLKKPASLNKELSEQTGFVLDPIFSLRKKVEIGPGERVQLVFLTAVGSTREEVVSMVEKYRDLGSAQRAFDLSWNFSQLQMRHLRIQQEETQLFQKFAGRIFYPHAQLRASQDRIRRNVLGQSSLWSQGISGDLPIVTVNVNDSHDLEFVREVLLAHTFWNMRGLKVDLVFLNEEAMGYDHPLFDEIQRLVFAYSQRAAPESPGGAYIRNISQLSADEINLLMAVARISLVASRGYLRQQLVTPLPPPYYTKWLTKEKSVKEAPSSPLPFLELPYFNGHGGYSPDGREYVIYLGPNENTPAPWINVIANPKFGFTVSESGLGSSWFGNSQSNRITPWSNDAVTNPIKDCLYIRDEELGVIFTTTPGPIRELDAYRIRHGQGYTIFEHNSHGIEQELTVFVPMNENEGLPVRIQILRLRNTSKRQRKLSVTAYLEWVLGGEPEETRTEVVTSWDAESQSLFARRRYHPDYGDYLAFTASNPPSQGFTADRTEFIGRNRSSSDPEGLRRQSLSGRNGAAMDPCSAEQVFFTLEPGETKEISFLLGYVDQEDYARKLVQQFRKEGEARALLNQASAWWDKALGTVQIETPDMAMNFAANRWLLYQNISCRIWGRTAFYQSSGAFGFRDQLQDCMAEMVIQPKRARDYILYAATRQFEEGDVQHWWHPKSGGGVRTRITDDRLWLVYVTAHYVKVTGDVSILDEKVAYIKSPVLEEHQHEIYNVPEISPHVGTLLEHCERAIQISQTSGTHGLPLMGGGDWNDGMNRVGIDGKGESVWLAWFFCHTLNDYAYLLDLTGQKGDNFRIEAKRLAALIEQGAWDGEWYRRAYFDDGSPLGSKVNQEARIDSLAQSWAVISGMGDKGRIPIALKSAEEHLVRKDVNTVLLLTPPFNKSQPDPGYIRSYPPGVRENGGQYTHGSLWLSLAFARMGDGAKALSLLRMMHPISHTENREKCAHYRVEPYVAVADIYDLERARGRGGWSWYTGSGGWMYRILVEEIIGFQKRGEKLVIDPSIPPSWSSYKITYRHEKAVYNISVLNPNHLSKGKIKLVIDGQERESGEIALSAEGIYNVEVTLV